MLNGITTNSQIYEMISENDISNILSHFDSSYIFETIKRNLSNRLFTSVLGSNPNITQSFENNFAYLKANIPSDVVNTNAVRSEVYLNIISILCNEYNLEYIGDQSSMPVDLYAAAYYTYDLLVSNFGNYIVKFFAKYICQEKDEIYSSLNLEELKRNKDSSTLYGKKIYGDNKLAVINANIDYVIANILGHDVSWQQLIGTLYENPDVANFIVSILAPKGDFYKDIFGPITHCVDYPIILTNIRLEIQKSINITEGEFLDGGDN